MPTDPPGLSALRSQALVAFTIEFDNEFEHRMPQRTSATGKVGAPRGAPWLVSEVIWANPDGWRAALPAPEMLPYHPAVLHRGRFPDGS